HFDATLTTSTALSPTRPPRSRGPPSRALMVTSSIAMAAEPTVRRMAGGGDEELEEVDEAGRVVRVVTRAEMRAANLRHRAVGIVVRRPGDGAVLVHRRAPWKDVWPS